MKNYIYYGIPTVVIIYVIFSVVTSLDENSQETRLSSQPKHAEKSADSIYLQRCPVSLSFDFPVNPPNATGYYNAQAFGRNHHVGDDWNGNGGGNSDLGDPIFSIGDGIVFFAENIGGGWGNVVRIYHNIGSPSHPQYIESLYGHLKIILVKQGDIVKKGQQIGTMGNVDGMYYAHLHLEIRDTIDMSIGGGYSKDTPGFFNPTQFIQSH
jgi:murein DD-endopeptidase MepM/ murein hydrolase activator NlpD